MASKTSTKSAAAKSSAAKKDAPAPAPEVKKDEAATAPAPESTEAAPDTESATTQEAKAAADAPVAETDAAPLNDNTAEMRVADEPEDFEGAGRVAPEEKARNEALAKEPVIETTGTTNEVAPSPYAETDGTIAGRADHIETQRAQAERVPSRHEGAEGVYAIDSKELPVGSAPTDERLRREAPSDLPIADGGEHSLAEPKNEAEGFKGAAALAPGDRIMAPGAPIEPPAVPAKVESPNEGNNEDFVPHNSGELGAAMIREARPGARLLDAATGEAPEPNSLFEAESRTGSAQRCTVRLVQHTYTGPHGRPLRQLVMTKGQVVGPEKAKQVVAILKAQIEADAAFDAAQDEAEGTDKDKADSGE